MIHCTDDIRIKELKRLISPDEVRCQHPITPAVETHISKSRHQINQIIHGKSDKLLIVLGPCSIHDTAAALEYAQRLASISTRFEDSLFLVMRVYFEKPRTSIGWKGLINDPHLDGSFDINHGLLTARKLLLDINQLNIAAASEFLDSITPQYTADLVSWGAIGARTTESQLHRELASGLSMPLGFKNGTDGNTQIAIDALRAASQPHHFLGITKDGAAAIVSTEGNQHAHIILRGSNNASNYSAEQVNTTINKLNSTNQNPRIMIDCSHGNSERDHLKQPIAAKDIAQQIAKGNNNIMGVMLESHLMAGKQKLSNGKKLAYGQSITDACMSWEATIEVLDTLAESVLARKQNTI